MEGQKAYIKHEKQQNGEPACFLLQAAVRLRSLRWGVDNHCMASVHYHQGRQKVVAVKIKVYHLMVMRSSELVRSRQEDLLVLVVAVIRKVMGMTATSGLIHTTAHKATGHRFLWARRSSSWGE